MSFCVQTRQQRLSQRHCVIAADGKNCLRLFVGEGLQGSINVRAGQRAVLAVRQRHGGVDCVHDLAVLQHGEQERFAIDGMGIADDENAADLAAAQEFRQCCQAVQPGREYGMRRERKLFHEHVLRWD